MNESEAKRGDGVRRERRKWTPVVALTAAASAFGIWAVSSPGASPEPASTAADVASSPTSSPPSSSAESVSGHQTDAERPGVPVGAYRLHYESTVRGSGVPRPASGDGVVTIDAQLEIAPPKAGLPEQWFSGRWARPSVLGERAFLDQLGLSGGPGVDFSAPFQFLLDDRGAVVARRFDPALPEPARAMVADLLNALAIVQPDRGSSWSAVETTSAGSVDAQYRRESGGALEKIWRGPVLVNGLSTGPNGAPGRWSVSGKTAFSLDAAGLAAANSSGEVQLELGGAAPIRLEASWRASVVRVGSVSGDWAGQLRPERLVGRDVTWAPQGRLLDAPTEPSGRPAGELVHAAADAAQRGDIEAQRVAGDDLAATLRADPTARAEVERLMRYADVPGGELRAMVEGLYTAETPETLETITRLLRDGEAPDMTQYSLATAAMFWQGTHGPIPAALISALEALSVRQNAAAPASLLALSSIARRVREAEQPHGVDPLAQGLEERVLGRAEAALGTCQSDPSAAGGCVDTGLKPGEVEMWLAALGNVGGEKGYVLIAPYLHHPVASIRRQAVLSIRFVDSKKARLALVETMQNDPEMRVRRAAIEATSFQASAPFEDAVIHALRTDLEPEVRLAAATQLAAWAYSSPGLLEPINAAIEREPNDAVRASLMNLLPNTEPAEEAPSVSRLPALPGPIGGAP